MPTLVPPIIDSTTYGSGAEVMAGQDGQGQICVGGTCWVDDVCDDDVVQSSVWEDAAGVFLLNTHTTPHRKPVTLPQELWDTVADHLAADRDALKACSLTCRSLLPRSRMHLHRSLTLRHRDYCIHPGSEVSRVTELEALPALLQNARKLHLSGERAHQCHHDCSPTEERKAGTELFWRVINRLSHITELTVSDLYWGFHTLEDKTRLCNAFPLVSCLDIQECEFTDADEMVAFVASFPKLVSVDVRWIYWYDAVRWKSVLEDMYSGFKVPSPYRAAQVPGGALSNLKNLRVGYTFHELHDLVRSLRACRPTAVESLTLGPLPQDIETLPIWVELLGGSLKHLCLTYGVSVHPKHARLSNATQEVLSSCNSLETVTFMSGASSSSQRRITRSAFEDCIIAFLESFTPPPKARLIQIASDAVLPLSRDMMKCLSHKLLDNVRVVLITASVPGDLAGL